MVEQVFCFILEIQLIRDLLMLRLLHLQVLVLQVGDPLGLDLLVLQQATLLLVCFDKIQDKEAQLSIKLGIFFSSLNNLV